jgi:hypothetical protein
VQRPAVTQPPGKLVVDLTPREQRPGPVRAGDGNGAEAAISAKQLVHELDWGVTRSDRDRYAELADRVDGWAPLERSPPARNAGVSAHVSPFLPVAT